MSRLAAWTTALHLTLSACAEPAELEPEPERRDLATFEAIELRANLEVGVLFGKSEHVNLSCDDGMSQHFAFKVVDAVLQVTDVDPPHAKRAHCVADLRMRDVHRMSNFGMGTLVSPADLAGRVDEIEAGSLGDIELATAGAEGLDVWLTGRANVRVGDMDYGGVRAWEWLSVLHEGSGDAYLRDMDLARVDVESSGSGDVFLSGLTDELSVRNDGQGTVATAAQRVDVLLTGGLTTVSVQERITGIVRSGATLILTGPGVEAEDFIVEEGGYVIRRH